jgi:plasmid stabilization system protein ParE
MGSDNKMYQVIFSDSAAEMLMQQVRFMAQVSESDAENLREEIIDGAKSLQNLPERNMWLSEPALPINKYRKMLISKRYLLIYKIKGETVYIEYVVDCRQDYQWLL